MKIITTRRRIQHSMPAQSVLIAAMISLALIEFHSVPPTIGCVSAFTAPPPIRRPPSAPRPRLASSSSCASVTALRSTTTLTIEDVTESSKSSSTNDQRKDRPNKFFSLHRQYNHHQQRRQRQEEEEDALSPKEFIMTYLEINGYLLTTSDGITVLIDPILEGDLDFGIPDLYTASKKTLPSKGLIEELPPTIDCLLLTQGLDDHAHVRTLTMLAQSGRLENTTILAPPSARRALQQSGLLSPPTNKLNVGFLSHGEKWTITPPPPPPPSSLSLGGLTIQATKGALVGPPWQTRENGYILRPRQQSQSLSTTSSEEGAGSSSPSIYIEPHVEFDPKELQRVGPVDVVISPIEGQQIASVFDLVFGPSKTIQLVELLNPKVIIPMFNGSVEASGPVSNVVSTNGSEQEFRQRLDEIPPKQTTGTRIENLIPGKDRRIRL